MNRLKSCLHAWPMLCAIVLAAGMLSVAPAHAQAAVTPTPAQAIVIQRLTLVKIDDLAFGTVAAGNTAGTITVTGGGTSTTGGTVAVGGSHPASFSGYGRTLQLVRIRLDRNNYSLVGPTGSTPMRMDTMIIGSNPPVPIGTPLQTFRITSLNGFFNFTIGGTLRVAANQRPGTYATTFRVEVEYL